MVDDFLLLLLAFILFLGEDLLVCDGGWEAGSGVVRTGCAILGVFLIAELFCEEATLDAYPLERDDVTDDMEVFLTGFVTGVCREGAGEVTEEVEMAALPRFHSSNISLRLF